MLKRGEKEIDLSVFGTIFQSAMSRIQTLMCKWHYMISTFQTMKFFCSRRFRR